MLELIFCSSYLLIKLLETDWFTKCFSLGKTIAPTALFKKLKPLNSWTTNITVASGFHVFSYWSTFVLDNAFLNVFFGNWIQHSSYSMIILLQYFITAIKHHFPLKIGIIKLGFKCHLILNFKTKNCSQSSCWFHTHKIPC